MAFVIITKTKETKFLPRNLLNILSFKTTICKPYPFKGQSQKTLLLTNCLSIFDHFLGLALTGLRKETNEKNAEQNANQT